MKKTIKIILTIIILLFVNLIYYVFIGQSNSAQKLEQNKELNLYECVSIYQMHTAVWMFGWIVAPEAAMEARLMHIKHRDPVIIHSSFPSLAKPELWKNGFYDYKDPQFKYVIALNTDDLIIKKNDYYTICSLTVKYTDNIHSICNIPINTCLFRYLQDINWLYPYKIIYIDEKVE